MRLDFHLQTLLTNRWKYLHENWSQFEAEIRNKSPNGETIDRRKLKSLADGKESVTFTIDELRILQEYLIEVGLVQVHENFIFRPPGSLLDSLHGEQAMTVFYPSRYLQEFNMEGASNWDVRAFEELHRTMEIAGLRVKLQDAFHDGNRYRDINKLKDKLSQEPWHAMLSDNNAIVSIGSPMSSYATEETLCTMFDIPPYEPQGLNAKTRLPFYLYWPGLSDDPRFSNSSFSVDRKQLKAQYPDQFAELRPDTRAILVGDKLHAAPKVGDNMNMVIAQYRNGHLVLVLLGIYAPATFAIAECVAERRITTTLGPYRYRAAAHDPDVDQQPILINLISTTITANDGSDGDSGGPDRDTRTVSDKKMVAWQRWQCLKDGYELIDAGDYLPMQSENKVNP